MKVRCYLLLLLAGMWNSCRTEKDFDGELNLIPRPVSVMMESGFFRLDGEVTVSAGPGAEESLMVLQELMRQYTGNGLKEVTRGQVVLTLDTLAGMEREAYQLDITPEQVRIAAGSAAGLFYGIQTFGQLLSDERFYNSGRQSWRLPALRISDYPAFSFWGLHLDVSRHFFPKEFVMKCLDWMAVYKLNRFHWHLTDAAGWRVEIRKYPELTRRAAWRSESGYMAWWKGDRQYVTRDSAGAYGGYYTREEIREVVAYAARKHITVIPEIEMPGHSEEVVSVYPHLGCYNEPYRNGEFCIGNEKTFEFVEGVLTEITDLFPSEYIHVGGDEASVAAWKKCPACQRRMKREGLKSERELQGYMIRRVECFLRKRGRKLIGWDEILEGGVAPGATVMSWRGETGGIKAARMGHDVVMTPGGYCYFDSYQADARTEPAAIGGFLPYLKVYSYHPVPEGLTPEEARHILGAQANLWTEYISDTAHAEYMIFPRLLALAEVVWTPQERREPEDFKRRIGKHTGWLSRMGVNAFPLSSRLEVRSEVDTAGKKMKVWFDAEKYRPQIRYSVNGGPELVYREPFYVTDSAKIEAFILDSGGRKGEIARARLDYHKAVGRKVEYRTRYSGSYPAAGGMTLTDGYRGGLTYGDGRWQGFLTHVDVVVDLEAVCDLSFVSAGFMQLTGPGVYMPEYVTVSVSEDGNTFQEVARIKNKVSIREKRLVIRDFTARFRARGRYVRLFAKKHAGFQFLDEIVIW